MTHPEIRKILKGVIKKADQCSFKYNPLHMNWTISHDVTLGHEVVDEGLKSDDMPVE